MSSFRRLRRWLIRSRAELNERLLSPAIEGMASVSKVSFDKFENWKRRSSQY
jgi:hypothetical protein